MLSAICGSLAALCAIFGWNFWRLRRATLNLIQDTLTWHVDSFWMPRKPKGFQIYLHRHWGFINKVTIENPTGVVVYEIVIPIKSDNIHPEAVSPATSTAITYGCIYAFDGFINEGLRAMGVPDLVDEEMAKGVRATR